MTMTDTPDCRTCGACCVEQLVFVFPNDLVPRELTQASPTFADVCVPVMRQQLGRCVALEGRVGIETSCRIYEQRPAICRALPAGSWACRKIRRARGLEPTTREDFEP